MTRHVNAKRLIAEDLHAALHEFIDDIVDLLFIAGDGIRRQHDEIVGTKLDLSMLGIRHTVKSRHRLTLASGGNDRDLRGLEAFDLGNVNERSRGDLHVTEIIRRLHDIEHRSAGQGNLSAVRDRVINDLLHAVHVRREGRNDDTALFIAQKDIVKRLTHRNLGGGISRPFGIGGFAHEKQNALLTQLTESRDIHDIAVDRRQIKLEVTRMQDHALGRMHRDRAGVGDRVVDTDEFHVHFARVDGRPPLRYADGA